MSDTTSRECYLITMSRRMTRSRTLLLEQFLILEEDGDDSSPAPATLEVSAAHK